MPHGSTDGEVLARSLSAAAQSMPFLITIPLAGGAAGNVDYIAPDRIRVVDVWAVQAALGELSDTIQVLNGSNAITNAMDWSGADKTTVRAMVGTFAAGGCRPNWAIV